MVQRNHPVDAMKKKLQVKFKPVCRISVGWCSLVQVHRSSVCDDVCQCKLGKCDYYDAVVGFLWCLTNDVFFRFLGLFGFRGCQFRLVVTMYVSTSMVGRYL